MNVALMFPLINGDMPRLIDVCLVLHEPVIDTQKALQEHVKENTNLLSFPTI